MFKKQNIIFLGGRRPINESASSKANPFKLTRNASNSSSKTSFYPQKSSINGGRLQPKPDSQRPQVLGDLTNSIEDSGQLQSREKSKITDSNLKVFEKTRQKEPAQSVQENIIERIQQQKKEFIEREKQRELERQRFVQLQQFQQHQHHQQLDSELRAREKSSLQMQSDLKDKNRDSQSSMLASRQESKKQPPKIVRSTGLVGLNNIGNTCFMNATLQCLFNVPDFNEYFFGEQFKSELRPNGRVAEQYAKLVTSICGNVVSSSETPAALKHAIGSRQSQFMGYSQQDAHELLVNLLECMGQDLSRVDKKSAVYQQLTADTKKHSITEISNNWWQYNKLRDDSVVIDFFSGQMMSEVVCTRCGNVSIAFDNFRDISLSFPRNQPSVTLTSLLEGFFREETLNEDCFCTNCKKPRLSKRRLSLFRLPRVLIVQLKRFAYGRWKKEKKNTQISFTHKLELGKHLHQEAVLGTKTLYSLMGVVNHTGGIDFGHYTADCRNPINGKWYHFNDSRVQESSSYGRQDRCEGSEPYLLFFYRDD